MHLRAKEAQMNKFNYAMLLALLMGLTGSASAMQPYYESNINCNGSGGVTIKLMGCTWDGSSNFYHCRSNYYQRGRYCGYARYSSSSSMLT
jgi:hypothetical protein